MNMHSKHKIDITALEENLKIALGELYIFEFKRRKNSGIKARAALMNLIKIAAKMRKEINTEIKALPVIKRNISPEALQSAKEKRQQTIAANKKNRSG